MKIRGAFRDVLKRSDVVVEDRGWRPNAISEDFGPFLASLLKKDHPQQVGIEYMAVGNAGSAQALKALVAEFFQSGDQSHPYRGETGQLWAWAKKVEPGDITYLDPGDREVGMTTNRLKIQVTFGQSEPNGATLDFREFALLGVDQDLKRLFLVNYVIHGPITKDPGMELSRTVKLFFPIGEE